MSQLSQTLRYIKPGVYTFTVPAGISEIEVAVWGAGGASGQGQTSATVSVGAVQIGTRVVGQELITPATTITRRVTEETVIPGDAGYIIPGGTRVVTDPGTTTVQLPTGVTQARVTATGGGGGGGVNSTGGSTKTTTAAPIQTPTGGTVARAPSTNAATNIKGGIIPSAPVTNTGVKGRAQTSQLSRNAK